MCMRIQTHVCVYIYIYIHTRKPCVSPSAETAKKLWVLIDFLGFPMEKARNTASDATQASEFSCVVTTASVASLPGRRLWGIIGHVNN